MKKEDIALIHKFVDDGLKALKENGLMTKSGYIPLEMQDDSFNGSEEYNSWQATKSTVSDADITALEIMVDCKLPLSFKTFLKYKHFYDLFLPGVMEVGFYKHPIRNWEKEYHEMYSYDWVREDLIGNRFIPFANHMDWGFLCFDARNPVENNEYPILMIDHEILGDIESYREFNKNFMEMVKSRLLYS